MFGIIYYMENISLRKKTIQRKYCQNWLAISSTMFSCMKAETMYPNHPAFLLSLRAQLLMTLKSSSASEYVLVSTFFPHCKLVLAGRATKYCVSQPDPQWGIYLFWLYGTKRPVVTLARSRGWVPALSKMQRQEGTELRVGAAALGPSTSVGCTGPGRGVIAAGCLGCCPSH